MNENKKFELIKIVIDKLLIGVIIVIVGVVGNAWLENYKNELIKKKTFYDKKYDMLNNMQISYKEMTDEVFTYIDNANNTNTTKLAYTNNSVKNFQKNATKVTPYISRDFSDKLEKYIWLYGVDLNKLNDVVQYADFFEFLENAFDEMIKHELDNSYVVTSKFEFVNMSYSEAKNIGPTKLFLQNYEKWKQLTNVHVRKN